MLQKVSKHGSDVADVGGKTSLTATREQPSLSSRLDYRAWMLSLIHSLACRWLASRLKLKGPDPSWYEASSCGIRDKQPRPWVRSFDHLRGALGEPWEGWRRSSNHPGALSRGPATSVSNAYSKSMEGHERREDSNNSRSLNKS